MQMVVSVQCSQAEHQNTKQSFGIMHVGDKCQRTRVYGACMQNIRIVLSGVFNMHNFLFKYGTRYKKLYLTSVYMTI